MKNKRIKSLAIVSVIFLLTTTNTFAKETVKGYQSESDLKLQGEEVR